MKPRVHWERWALLVNAGALVAVIALGSAWSSLRRAVVFLIVGTATAAYNEAVLLVSRRRAERQSAIEVPRGVRLRRPLWLSLDDPLTLLALAAPFAALAATVGFAGVGAGILLAVGAIGVSMGVVTSVWLSPRALTFETDGLRVHLRSVSFFVRWDAITDVQRVGDEGRLVYVRLLETGSAIRSVDPDTPQTRRRVWLVLSDGDSPSGKLALERWTAGLDAAVLVRVILAASKGEDERTN